jgi:hypothetical protein
MPRISKCGNCAHCLARSSKRRCLEPIALTKTPRRIVSESVSTCQSRGEAVESDASTGTSEGSHDALQIESSSGEALSRQENSDGESIEDVEAELASAIGKPVEVLRRIRKTPTGLVALVDTMSTFFDITRIQSRKALQHLWDRNPDLAPTKEQIVYHRFGGRGRPTPVASLSIVYEVLMLLPGKRAATARSSAAKLVVRYLGGDLSLVREVEANRTFQERLKRENPAAPERIFGEEVEKMPKAYATTSLGLSDHRDLYLGHSGAHPDLVKVGITERLCERTQEHARRLGDFSIFHVFFGAGCLERKFKQLFAPRQVKIEVNGQTHTEYFRLSEAEAIAGVHASAKVVEAEREAEALKHEKALEQEHKRRRLEAETRLIEAECKHKERISEAEIHIHIEHKRRRMDAETRVIEAQAARQIERL